MGQVITNYKVTAGQDGAPQLGTNLWVSGLTFGGKLQNKYGRIYNI